MSEPLGPALAIGLATIVGLVGFAIVVTRRERAAAARVRSIRPRSAKLEAVEGPLAILRISPAAGEAALQAHELDAEERLVFEAMDQAVQARCGHTDAEAELEANFDCVAAVGRRFGLDRSQSIAFWVRSTFGLFEPRDG